MSDAAAAGGRTVTARVVPPGWARGPRAWLAGHPVLVDTAVAAALLVTTAVGDTWGPDGRHRGAWVFDILLCAPLAVRRLRPVPVAVVVGGVCLAQWATGVQAIGVWAVLVVLFTLGSEPVGRAVPLVSLVLGELGIGLAVTRWAPAGHHLVIALTGSGTVLAALLLGVTHRVRRARADWQLQRALDAERDRDLQIRLAVTAERTRVAREMHDIVAHSLSVMITLNDAAATVDPASPATPEVRRAAAVGRGALADMRRLLGALRGDDAVPDRPQPGAAQLGELVEVVRRTGVPASLTTSGRLSAVPATAQLAAYRIVQEGLTNVLKHAGNVTRVEVDVRIADNYLTVAVLDDGRAGDHRDTDRDRNARRNGAATGAGAAAVGGHGLTGMRERVALFAGELSCGPRAGGGWLVRARLDVGPAVATPLSEMVEPVPVAGAAR